MAFLFGSFSVRFPTHSRQECYLNLGRRGSWISMTAARSSSSVSDHLFQGELFHSQDGIGFNMDGAERFLRQYWQKRPVVFRSALDATQLTELLTPDELAGLACEEDVSSRMIIHWGGLPDAPQNKPDWELLVGPFQENDFAKIPDTHCSLLVQDVNANDSAVSDLLSLFSFIPNWRVDDVMVSYAGEGGGVGPHVDNYDVFLLQGRGKRRWKASLTKVPPEEETLVPDLDVRILADPFPEEIDVVLEPGDMLYVPPRFPHWGVSMDDQCMTYSIGFRAPSYAELITGYADSIAEELQEMFYEDDVEDLIHQLREGGYGDPGQITPVAIQRARDIVSKSLFPNGVHYQGYDRFARFFCRAISEPKRFRESFDLGVGTIRKRGTLAESLSHCFDHDCEWREDVVFAWNLIEEGQTGQLLVDGESWLIPDSNTVPKPIQVEFLRLLCLSRMILPPHRLQLEDLTQQYPPLKDLGLELFHRGFLRQVELED